MITIEMLTHTVTGLSAEDLRRWIDNAWVRPYGQPGQYRFHDIDPIFFAHGIRLACRCGEKRGDKVFGTTGKPMPTTYTTYVWIYEW